MLHYNVALVTSSAHVNLSDLLPVAAALSKQMVRDFSPMWRRTANVSAFPADNVPVGYYKISVEDNINEPGAAGYHTDSNNQPYSLIQYSPDWSVTLSHELIEMIADPWGNRLYPGTLFGRRVLILQELCDPCEAFTYTCDGVAVSDFLTPEWYDPTLTSGKHYSFLGKLSGPHTVADGGYLSWLDPANDHWYQQTFFGTQQITDLGHASEVMKGFRTIREAIDYHGATRHSALGKGTGK